MSQDRHAQLDAFWGNVVKNLNNESTDADFQKYGGYFSPNATSYFNGMGAPPASGREGAVEAVKQLTQFWKLAERRVISRSTSADGKVAVTEMDNSLVICGEPVEHFPETEIVEFDDNGLFVGYRLYCDTRPIVDIVAKHIPTEDSSASE